MIFFVDSLRGGGEGFIMYVAGLQHQIGKVIEGPLYRVLIPLMGRFKESTGIRVHLQAVVNETASKLKVS